MAGTAAQRAYWRERQRLSRRRRFGPSQALYRQQQERQARARDRVRELLRQIPARGSRWPREARRAWLAELARAIDAGYSE